MTTACVRLLFVIKNIVSWTIWKALDFVTQKLKK